MQGSFEDDEIVIRMSIMDAREIATELMYTIDYQDDQYIEYSALRDALFHAIGKSGNYA